MLNNIKNLIIYMWIILLYCMPILYGQGLIVNHNAVQGFDDIPDYWLEQAKQLTVHYGHTSHGSQIISGLNYLETYIDDIKYNVAITDRNSSRTPILAPPQNALRMWEEGLWPDTDDGNLGYWDGQAAQDGTRNVLNSGLFNVSGWAWCGQVALEEWSYIQSYLDAMNQFEQEFPDVKFFYMTGHCVAPGPPIYQQIAYDRLQANNNGIRNYCINNNKILYDFADIEAWDLDGIYHPEEDGTCVWGEAWCNQNPNECQNLPLFSDGGGGASCTTCAHAYGLTCVIKGKAFWYMMARIAGWDGITTALNETIELNNQLPDDIFLKQNYPNPFNPSTTISYSNPQSNHVELIIYDITGNKVSKLVDKFQKVGSYNIVWKVNDNLPSGQYFYKLQIGNISQMKSMILIK